MNIPNYYPDEPPFDKDGSPCMTAHLYGDKFGTRIGLRAGGDIKIVWYR